MSKQHDKLMTDLHRLLGTQNFETEEDLMKFLDSMVGQEIPSFDTEALSPEERAQDIVFEAYEMPDDEAKESIEIALNLDPECIEAYEFLGKREPFPTIASVFYEKGITIGRQKFGGAYLKKHKGMFWGLHETRPFMRCLEYFAYCKYLLGKTKDTIAIYEELIALNPNDNQGVRDQLMLYLIKLGDNKKFLKYAKMYDDQIGAFPLFNRALFAFKTEGTTENANKLLANAHQFNKYVVKKLLAKNPSKNVPEQYSMGDAREASIYDVYARDIWNETPGAKEWLQKQILKK